MKNTSWLVSTIAFIFFTSCASGSGDKKASTVDVSNTSGTSQNVIADTSKSVWNDVNSSNPPKLQKIGVPANQGAQVALNPAHGQPNHRCDIEVGAPLNSPKQQAPQTAPPPKTLPSMGTQQTVKLNPAHGQPGHDCAVAVGAPLKGL